MKYVLLGELYSLFEIDGVILSFSEFVKGIDLHLGLRVTKLYPSPVDASVFN